LRSSCRSIRLDRVQDQLRSTMPKTERPRPRSGVAAAEDALRGGVVKDPALAVADENALVQLGDERSDRLRSASTARVGVGHGGRDVLSGAARRAARSGAGQQPQLGRSRRRDAVRRIPLRDQAHGLGQPARRGGRCREQAIAQDRERRREREREQHQQPDPRRSENGGDGLAIGRGEVGPQGDCADGEDRERQRGRHQHGREGPAAHVASNSLTFATSSRVEKGLVT
jgi:hypothetical protein